MKKSCSHSSWFTAACMAAKDHNVPVHRVIGGCRRPATVKARWAAWRALMEKNRDYSISGIAKAGGFNHTTVLNGLGRLARNRVRS